MESHEEEEVASASSLPMPAYPSKRAFIAAHQTPHWQGSSLTCPICLDFIAFNQLLAPGVMREKAIKLKPCGHVFGASCLAIWLRTSNTCPMCRHPLFEKAPMNAVFETPSRQNFNGFAGYMEGTMGSADTARRIREDPFAIWVREIMRATLLEIVEETEGGGRRVVVTFADEMEHYEDVTEHENEHVEDEVAGDGNEDDEHEHEDDSMDSPPDLDEVEGAFDEQNEQNEHDGELGIRYHMEEIAEDYDYEDGWTFVARPRARRQRGYRGR